MRFFVFILAVCGALWWTDAHFFRGEYTIALQREGVALKSVIEREIDRLLRIVSP